MAFLDAAIRLAGERLARGLGLGEGLRGTPDPFRSLGLGEGFRPLPPLGLGEGLGPLPPLGLGGASPGILGLAALDLLRPAGEWLSALLARLPLRPPPAAAVAPTTAPALLSGPLGPLEPLRALLQEVAARSGVPPAYWAAAIMAESQGNPRAVGDAGQSFGLLQLHLRGRGMPFAYQPERLFDPRLNLELSIPDFQRAYRAATAAGLTPNTPEHLAYTIAQAQRFQGYEDPRSPAYQRVLALGAQYLLRQQALAGAAAAPPEREGYVFPLPEYTGEIQPHHGQAVGGVDLFAPQGTPVRAMRGGEVVAAGFSAIGGHYVLIRGDDGRMYYYAHLEGPPRVRAGEPVRAGQLIGAVGETGNARGRGPHLHLGVGREILSGTGPLGGTGTDFDLVAFLRALLGR